MEFKLLFCVYQLIIYLAIQLIALEESSFVSQATWVALLQLTAQLAEPGLLQVQQPLGILFNAWVPCFLCHLWLQVDVEWHDCYRIIFTIFAAIILAKQQDKRIKLRIILFPCSSSSFFFFCLPSVQIALQFQGLWGSIMLLLFSHKQFHWLQIFTLLGPVDSCQKILEQGFY